MILKFWISVYINLKHIFFFLIDLDSFNFINTKTQNFLQSPSMKNRPPNPSQPPQKYSDRHLFLHQLSPLSFKNSLSSSFLLYNNQDFFYSFNNNPSLVRITVLFVLLLEWLFVLFLKWLVCFWFFSLLVCVIENDSIGVSKDLENPHRDWVRGGNLKSSPFTIEDYSYYEGICPSNFSCCN